MSRFPLTLSAAALLAAGLGGVALGADEAPSVRALVAQLAPCQELDCPPIVALVERGPAIWPEIRVGLEDEREMIRFWTLGVLSEVAIVDARPELGELLLKDPMVRIRAAAAFALGNQRSPAVAPLLAQALRDDDVNVRFEAASALGRSPAKGVVPELLRALTDRDEDVRAAVLEALAATGDERAVDSALRRATRDPVPRVRGVAAVALANLRAAVAVEPLIERLGIENDPEALAAVCWALGELADPQAVEPLRRLADHSDARVREHAQDAVDKLSRGGDEAPAEPSP